MAGQGCPLATSAWHLRRLLRSASWRIAPAAMLLVALALGHSTPSHAAESDLRLRIAWGGGEARQWQGTIRVSEGTLAEVTPLGLEADSPGSMVLTDPGTLRIYPRTPHNYDGCDVRVQGPSDARLTIEIFADDQPAGPPIELSLAQVKQGVQRFDLDGQGNSLMAQRSPGDQLRVTLSHDALIFAPSERLEFEVIPHEAGLAPNATYLLSTNVLRARTSEVLSSEDREIKTDAQGQAAAVSSYALKLPEFEGIFDVQLALYPKRLTTPLVRGKPVLQRKLQVVVVEPVKPLDRSSPDWITQQTLDPANPSWWAALTRLPAIPTALPGMRKLPTLSQKPLSHGRIGTREHLDTTFVELGPNAWQALPLSIAETGRPYVLEVEYPSDLEQTLAISLVEPNAAGQVIPIGLDSGIDVPPASSGNAARIEKHRLVFWPQTYAPLVLLVNRRDNQPAYYAKIRVERGPDELPEMSLPVASMPLRQLTAYFDKPLFPENFSAGEALDAATGRTYDDWQTFYLGGTRLVQMLKHTGYSSAIVTVACEGSAIYPSQLLQPTPKYDTGTYFESGQDPLRKDVVELLFRLFDRAGIQFVPGIAFSAPLPELEKIRLAGGAAADGLEPLGQDGLTWTARNGVRRGLAPYYNLLDPRVQAALRNVVQELVTRYGHHPSFGGVAVQLGPETYALLPDGSCSYDDTTIARFRRETGVDFPEQPGTRLVDRHRYLEGEGAQAWLAWRAEQVAAHYKRLQKDITTQQPRARLFLTTAELLTGRKTQLALRPTLPQQSNPGQALLRLGIDPVRLGGPGGVVLPRPQRIVASTFPGGQSIYGQWNRATDLDALFAHSGGLNGSAMMAYHEPSATGLPTFDEQSPLGTGKTRTWLVSQLARAGASNRQRFVHAVAASDAQLLIDGGWMLPLGQHVALRSLVEVYRRLPAEPFHDVQAKATGARTQPVVVRTLQRGTKTYFYLTNDSPWPLTVEVDFVSAAPVRLESYATQNQSRLKQQEGRATWSVELEPYDLVGGEIAGTQVRVDSWRVTYASEVEEDLKQQIRSVRLRANALRSPAEKNVLINPSFELAGTSASPALDTLGWVHATGAGIHVAVDAQQGHHSPKSLRIASHPAQPGQTSPVAWVRSDPFAAPDTGRICIVCSLRLADPRQQPQLRVAIEGKLDGQPYYKRCNVGANEDGTPVTPLAAGWQSRQFIFDELPLAGLTELRVGFDLMGEGDVWVDEVQVFETWFRDNERDELLKNIATADFQLSAGQIGDCERFLDGYWPRFLRQYVPLDHGDVAANPGLARPLATGTARPAMEANPPPSAKAAEAAPAEKPSMLERMRNWWSRPSSPSKTKRM